MKLQEFAETFGMTVTGLAEYTGYSRPTLYKLFRSGSRCDDRRIKAMIRQLILKTAKDRERQLTVANREYDKRMKLLETLTREKCG